MTKTPSLPGLSRNSDFRQRLFGLDESHHPMVATMTLWGEFFLRYSLNNVRHRGTQLVLAGPTGTGKTHIARAIFDQVGAWGADAVLSEGWRGKFPFRIWADWPDIAEIERGETFNEWLLDVKESQVIFLDDVGSESDRFRSGESASRLRRVLGYSQAKWLLITTNLSKTDFFSTYDARVVDRLSAAHWCDLSGVPSYRPKLRPASRYE